MDRVHMPGPNTAVILVGARIEFLTMRGAWIALVALTTLVGCGSGGDGGITTSSEQMPTTTTVSVSASSSAIAAPPPPPAPAAAPPGCGDAPAVLLDQINAAFTNGEHLENAQAVDGSQAATYVGGNIVDTAGQRVSSQDSWVLFDGQVYALTSGARRHTTLKDGRDVDAIYSQWSGFNDEVGECVGAATKGQL